LTGVALGLNQFDTQLHKYRCQGCAKADWDNNRCHAITAPKAVLAKGACWARSDDPAWREKLEEAQTQYQQARGISPAYAFLSDMESCERMRWLMSTRQTDLREREVMPPGRPVFKSSSRNRKRKKRMPPANSFYNPYLGE
jgi:hypothetical protein